MLQNLIELTLLGDVTILRKDGQWLTQCIIKDNNGQYYIEAAWNKKISKALADLVPKVYKNHVSQNN